MPMAKFAVSPAAWPSSAGSPPAGSAPQRSPRGAPHSERDGGAAVENGVFKNDEDCGIV